VADPRYPQLSGTRSAVLLDYGSSVRATITANHGHCYGARRQESYLKWEASAGAVVATMGLLLDYPRGLPERLEVCRLRDGEPRWTDVPLEGRWFPHAFLGTMGSLQAHAEDASQPLPTSVEDACRTMALVEAAYRACASGGVNVPEG
jgi:predicted dehydrogenase